MLRPVGQVKVPDADAPRFAPCGRLDYELELGVWIAGHNDLGQPVPIADALHRVGGHGVAERLVGARLAGVGIPAAGVVPGEEFPHHRIALGRHSRGTGTLSCGAVAPAAGDPAPLPYLTDAVDQVAGALSIDLEVTLSTAAMRSSGMPQFRPSHGNAARAMYWTVAAQMVTHHASNGCDLHPGDLLGTGTLSGLHQRASAV